MKNGFKANKGSEKRPRKAGDFKPSSHSHSGDSAGGKANYNYRNNPKTFGKPIDDKPGFDRSKPRFDGEKPRASRSETPNKYQPKTFGTSNRFDNKRFDDRPPRKEFSDKPRFGDDMPRFGNDKPRFESSGDRPQRKNFENRPARKDFGDKPRFGNDKPRFDENQPRPAGKFDNDKSRFAPAPGRTPRSFGEAPRTPRAPKRFEGPYQKNLNTDVGGAQRSNRRDKYRSDGAAFDYETRVKETIEEKNGTIRLNRFIANSGICSRRDADELIEAGQITVNGEIITEMGHQVRPTDVIKYGNKLLTREKMVYILLNKPKDYITTTEDPLERKTVMKLIEGACKERVYPVGRLDRNTTGLLLFTNDGELASKLTHPSNNVEKMYQVEIDKPITEEHYQAILKGITLEDGEIKADSLGIVTPDAQVIGIQIHSGRNHIVRRIFAHLGYEVLKLDRTVFAGLNKKDLPRSNYRHLTEKEVIKLKYLS
jgi:23S rRNA pseudouridine2605 synthase